MTGPKKEDDTSPGMRYHTKDKSGGPGQPSVWEYEERPIVARRSAMLLARILIGKVENRRQLEDVLRHVQVVQGDKSWNCVIWVKNALEALQSNRKAVGTSSLDWSKVRAASMKYIQQKKDQHRYDGKAEFDASKTATLDLLEGRETVP